MDFIALRYFLTAARLLHFGQAADALGIAQPALSQRIKSLETRLRVKLFDRTKRSVRLTEAGKVFVVEAEHLLSQADLAVRITRAAAQGTAGELRIGYGGSVIFEPKVCALLQAFQTAYPDVSVLMHECKVEEQLEGVKAGRLDVSLLWGPLGPGFPELRELVFLRASMSVVLPRDHPLAVKPLLHLEELRNEAFIALTDPPGRGIAHVVDQIFAVSELSPRIVLRVNSLLSVLGLAGAGIGLGIVPMLPVGIISPSFVQRPLAGTADCNEILIAMSRSRISELTQNFIEMAQAHRTSAQELSEE